MLNVRTILCVCAVFSLNACETIYYPKNQPSDLNQTQLGHGVSITPPPVPGENIGTHIVDNTDFVPPHAGNGVALVPIGLPQLPILTHSPDFSGGVLTNDSSVTVFPLDGDVTSPSPSGAVTYEAPLGTASVENVPLFNNATTDMQIFFKHGSSRLGRGDQQKLSSTADQAKFAPVSRVTVAGYASKPTQLGSGTVEGHILNLKQSMNRAFAVSRQLMRNGVPAEKLKAVSWGATKSTGNNSQDRRVDVVMGEQ